uniref:hypothetical protein n=1 Tax=Burkholderia cepacia TaxID=292 RepID=UPI0015E85F45|nr:hypothetical protein [Burkholderia cepacia]
MQQLLEHSWPGNVRELRNLVERLVVISPTDIIGTNSLPEKLAPGFSEDFSAGLDFKAAVAAYERKLARAAIDKYGSISEAAKNLAISESTVKRKLRMDAEASDLNAD